MEFLGLGSWALVRRTSPLRQSETHRTHKPPLPLSLPSNRPSAPLAKPYLLPTLPSSSFAPSMIPNTGPTVSTHAPTPPRMHPTIFLSQPAPSPNTDLSHQQNMKDLISICCHEANSLKAYIPVHSPPLLSYAPVLNGLRRTVLWMGIENENRAMDMKDKRTKSRRRTAGQIRTKTVLWKSKMMRTKTAR